MESERWGDATPRIVFGFIILLLGVLFLLDKLDLVEVGSLWEYWPLVFVGVGLGKLMQPTGTRGRASGVVFIVVGVWWLLSNLDVIPYEPLDFWPVILILIGGSMLMRSIERQRAGEPPAYPAPDAALGPPPAPPPGTTPTPPVTPYEADRFIHAVAVLGGYGRKSASPDFRGGDITAIMGGCEVDLRQASIASGEAAIEVFALWGGIELRVPRDWTVISRGTPLLGGFEDLTVPPASPTGKVLVVRGMALMGGVEIKN